MRVPTLRGSGGVDGGMRFVIMAPIARGPPHVTSHDALRVPSPPGVLHLLLHQSLQPHSIPEAGTRLRASKGL